MTRLHHLAIGTPDVSRLAEFYREVFELAEVARHDDEHGSLRAVWLDLGGSLLMIERTAASRERVEGVGGGLFLLALRVGVEERPRLERALSARGHAVEARTTYSSYTRDPDGNRVAFSHHPEPEGSLA
jgi:catechol 2,3-dioxygenase-like lactoylglutathione lyase family enzyme